MRVLLVLGTSAGGVGRHVRRLAEWLTGAGHLVTVAAPSDEIRRFEFDQVAEAVPMELSDRPRPGQDTEAMRSLRKLAADVDLIDAHGLRAGSLACIAVHGVVPIVVTLHNAAPSGKLTKAVYNGLERLVAKQATLVLGVSTDLVDRMEKLGADGPELAVVPAPDFQRQRRSRSDTRSLLGVGPEQALVITVARLAEQKGLDVLLDAANLLHQQPLLIAIVGDGPLEEPLSARISNEGLPVSLLGHRDDVPDLLTAADVAVSAAQWEGQPLWLQEAVQAGAAIVATDVGGTAAVVEDAALLIPPGNPQAIADGIQKVLDDPFLRAELQSKARIRAMALPTSSDAIKAALHSYDEARERFSASSSS